MAIDDLSEPLRSFLAPFEPCNPLPFIDLKMDEHTFKKTKYADKLVYASFGTLYHGDAQSFIKIIDAIKQLNERSEFGHIRLVASTGAPTYELFDQLVKSKQIEIPDFVLLMPRVPQLSILKRASLFITHCGQNSTSESIHYGVPMVCIPVMSDQPPVAYRAADELGLGVRLTYQDLTTEQIRAAIEEILRDNAYLERSLLYAKISRKYNGTVNASKIVTEILEYSSKAKLKAA